MASCQSCGAATLNICVRTNEDYINQFEFRSADQPVDLTGWTIAMQIKGGLEAAALVSLTSTAPTFNQSRITFLDAELGQVEIFIAQADLAALTIPAGQSKRVFQYDIRMTDTTPITAVFVAGEFSVQRGVTS